MMKRAFLVSFIVAALTGSVTLNAQTVASSNERQKRKILKKLKASEAVQIYADNSQGSSLYIQEASVKEIAGDDFAILAGEPPRHFRQATFPEVTLFNSSAKTIKSFAIVVKSAADRPQSGHVLLKNSLSIPPNSAYAVASSEWIKAERVSIQEGNKFENRLRQPGLDSAKAWIPGAASDLKVTVGLVEFEDGTRWMISRDSNW
jgi:hypothetical protein